MPSSKAPRPVSARTSQVWADTRPDAGPSLSGTPALRVQAVPQQVYGLLEVTGRQVRLSQAEGGQDPEPPVVKRGRQAGGASTRVRRLRRAPR